MESPGWKTLGWKTVVALALVAAGSQLAGASERRAAAPRGGRAAWAWNNAIVDSAEKRDEFLSFCRQRRINVVFLYAGAKDLRARAPRFRAFLAAAHRKKMRVDALDGDPSWGLRAHRGGAEEFFAALREFQQAGAPPAERFDGVHLDVESYDRPEWKAAETQAAEEYLEFLEWARAQAGGLRMAADVPPWFGHVQVAQGRLLGAVIERVDEVGLMAYSEQVKGQMALARPALEYAAQQRKGVWVGVSAQLYDSDMDPRQPLREQVERVVKASERRLKRYASFRGVAIHDLEHFLALYGKAPGKRQAPDRPRP